jgi:tetratricopeptide (TPR) repeat protein
LLEPAAAGTVGRHLRTLTARGFVSPGAEDEHRFRHGLIRDAVYRATLKADRGALHERFADVLEGDPEELDELVGYHLERAYAFRLEIGAGERVLERLAADAGERLGAAGIRACKRGDAPAAVNLLRRATSLLPASSTTWELACELAIGLRAVGQLGQAEHVLAETVESAEAAEDRRLAARARLELANLRLFRTPSTSGDELRAIAASARPIFTALGDHRGLGRTWLLAGTFESTLQRRDAIRLEAGQEALEHYRRSGWPPSGCLGMISDALVNGPTPVDEAVERCESLLLSADAVGEAYVRHSLASLTAMRTDFDDARRQLDRARALFEDLGLTGIAESACPLTAASIELGAGDAAAAAAALRLGIEALTRFDDRSSLAEAGALLAEALYRESRFDEAEEWLKLSSKHANAEAPATTLWARGVRAKLLAQNGRFAEGEAAAAEAVAIARETDWLTKHATIVLDLAEVVRLAGDAARADDLAEQARSLFEQKGNTAGALRARSYASHVLSS